MPATILCADVDRQLFQILETALRDEGFAALPAFDGEAALQLARDEAPALVLLDITMPKRDGFDVLQEIRKLEGPLADVPVLLTCGSRISPNYEERADQLGAQALLAKPVPLEDLLGHIRRHVKCSPPEARTGSARGHEGAAVEGDLSEIGFPHLLHRLHGLRATGVLMISNAKKKKAIQMRDGYAVAVKSNLVHECLGHHLVRSGRLSQEAVTESLARMKKGGGLQGQILVAMDVITEDEISAALREQAEDKLFEIFEWRRGRFKLEVSNRLKRGNTLALETSPANIILEGVRRRTAPELVAAFHDEHGGRYVARGESPFYRFQEIDLNEEEQALVDGLDGTATLAGVANGDDGMQRTLYGLLAAELLELRSGPDESAPVIPAKPPAVTQKAATAPDDDSKLRNRLGALAKRLRGKNYFQVLDVDERADSDEIAQAYERLAKNAHPDRFANASENLRQLADEVFQLVSEAHDTLSDPDRRAKYAEQQKRGEQSAAKQDKSRRAVQAEVDFQQGDDLLARRDYERALGYFSRAREAAPREGEYLAHYAWCMYLCNPDNATVVQEALAHLRRAVALARDQEKSYLFLGRLCKVVGDTAAAEKMFTRAVQIRPECVEAMRELRLINMRRGKGLIGRLLRR